MSLCYLILLIHIHVSCLRHNVNGSGKRKPHQQTMYIEVFLMPLLFQLQFCLKPEGESLLLTDVVAAIYFAVVTGLVNKDSWLLV